MNNSDYTNAIYNGIHNPAYKNSLHSSPRKSINDNRRDGNYVSTSNNINSNASANNKINIQTNKLEIKNEPNNDINRNQTAYQIIPNTTVTVRPIDISKNRDKKNIRPSHTIRNSNFHKVNSINSLDSDGYEDVFLRNNTQNQSQIYNNNVNFSRREEEENSYSCIANLHDNKNQKGFTTTCKNCQPLPLKSNLKPVSSCNINLESGQDQPVEVEKSAINKRVTFLKRTLSDSNLGSQRESKFKNSLTRELGVDVDFDKLDPLAKTTIGLPGSYSNNTQNKGFAVSHYYDSVPPIETKTIYFNNGNTMFTSKRKNNNISVVNNPIAQASENENHNQIDFVINNFGEIHANTLNTNSNIKAYKSAPTTTRNRGGVDNLQISTTDSYIDDLGSSVPYYQSNSLESDLDRNNLSASNQHVGVIHGSRKNPNIYNRNSDPNNIRRKSTFRNRLASGWPNMPDFPNIHFPGSKLFHADVNSEEAKKERTIYFAPEDLLPEDKDLLIDRLPRLSAYSDLSYSLTSGFIPHAIINVISVSKTRSYVYRFKDSFDIVLSHGPEGKFKWTIRRGWNELVDLFEIIKEHKNGGNYLERWKDVIEDIDMRRKGLVSSKSQKDKAKTLDLHHQSISQKVYGYSNVGTGHDFGGSRENFMMTSLNVDKLSTSKATERPNEGDHRPSRPTGQPTDRLASVKERWKSMKFTRKPFNRSTKKSKKNLLEPVIFPSEKYELKRKTEEIKNWLQKVLNSRECRTLRKVQKFLAVSRLSFIEDFGGKRSEVISKKMSGGYVGQSRFLHHLSSNFIINWVSRSWSDKVVVVKDSCICYLSLDDSEIRGVMLFDNNFFAEPGHFSSNVVISNCSRTLEIKCKDHYEARQLLDSITEICDDEKQDGNQLISSDTPYNSFAPKRDDSLARHFVCGRDYFWYLSCCLEAAKSEIYIADWFLSPEVSLRRPDKTGYWKIKNILHRKAKEGIKITVLIYDAPELALDHGLATTERVLTDLKLSDGNVQILRHACGVEQRFLYAHHEKLAIIDQKVAFVGGIDVCAGRFEDTNYHLFDHPNEKTGKFNNTTGDWYTFDGKDYQNPFKADMTSETWSIDQLDRRQSCRMPWHDIHSVVFGKAATDIARHFILRWNFTKQAVGSKNQKDTATEKRTCLLLPISTNSAMSSVTEDEFLNPELENGEKPENPPYIVDAQAIRSLSQWSGGIRETETSILNAYISLISRAEKFIYIENQFFITNSNDFNNNDMPEVHNKIGHALCERIERAHLRKEEFKVYVVMPLMPCFRSDIKQADKSSEAVKAILHFQYSSICREDKSDMSSNPYWCMYKRLSQHGVTKPENYIQFCSLRKHCYKDDPNNTPCTEIVYVHSKLMIIDDKHTIIGSANINDRSMLGERDSEVCCIYSDKNGSKFAKDLRLKVWSRFLDRPICEINDYRPESDEFFHNIWHQQSKDNATRYFSVFMEPPVDNIYNFEGLGILQTQHKKLHANSRELGSAIKRNALDKIKGILVKMPLNFLREEILHPKNFNFGKEKIAPLDMWT